MINIKLIKEIRQKTGLSIIKCKEYLEKYQNNVDLACYHLKKDNIFINKNNNSIINGIILVKKFYNYSIIIQLNCLTDFVSKNKIFIELGNEIINYIFLHKNIDINFINNKISKKINFVQNKFGETITLTNFYNIKNSLCYQHQNRIGVIVLFSNEQEIEIKKKILMHITSLDNEYISIYDIYYVEFNLIINAIINKFKEKKNCIKKELYEYFIKNILLYQTFIFNNNNIFNILFYNKIVILKYLKLKI